MKRFENKIVVVTGGSRGLGAATVRRFASEGAHIVINYHSDDQTAESLQTELRQSGTRTLLVQADIGVEADITRMVDLVIKTFGTIDILVNNAGIVFDTPFANKSITEWERTIAVNLSGQYYCIRNFMPHFRPGGSIVNIASTNGIDCYHPDSVDYDVSKAGVIMLTKSMARALAPDIRINCVAPGWFDSDMNTGLSKEYVSRETAKIALGRFGSADEIAAVVTFLASDDARYMTGSVVIADGGYGGSN